MKGAAAKAIAGVIPDDHISEDFIIPSVFDKNVAKRVARGVARVAQETGIARRRQRRGDEIYAAFKS
jgi:malate dehydrogenase (oxaloacetate-decarboxylating)